MKKYKIIYADPPWRYGSLNYPDPYAPPYPTMSMEEIKSLPIADLADENCALFLWTTFPKLKEQIKLFEAWGFKYKTVGFTWIKTNQWNDKPFLGIGKYTKSNSEVCLLGIKGEMKPISDTVNSAVISHRREHSRKPDEIRDRIVQLFGDLPRIELFARQRVKDWDAWGNEVECDIEMKVENALAIARLDELKQIKKKQEIFKGGIER